MRTKKTITYYLLIIIGIVVLVNILADKFFMRLDFTEDKIYTLSDATKDILQELENPVTITAYFSEDLPPHIAKTRSDFKDLLIEYSSYANGNLVYEFINPNENDEAEQKAQQSGIQPVLINVREKDQVKQQKAYLGAVVQLGENSDIIPFMQPGAAMEYALSSSIKKLTVQEKPVIGFVNGHGEPELTRLRAVKEQLSILYDIEPVTLATADLSAYNTLAIVAPKDTVPSADLAKLDGFLARGGHLFVACNRVDADLSQGLQGNALNTGLETWLANKGLTVENNFIIDQQCGSVGVPQQHGFLRIMAQVPFPYVPIISNFADHPITKGLETVVMQFASSITFTGDTSLTYTPLVYTSNMSGTRPSPVYFDINKEWSEVDFPLEKLTLGAVVSGKIVGDAESKIVLISDGDFPIEPENAQQQQQQIQPDNVSLIVNSIDWLSDDTGLIELRTKGVTSRLLDQVDDGTKVLLKWLNFLAPILLIIIYGIFRTQRNRNLRIKRMEEDYV